MEADRDLTARPLPWIACDLPLDPIPGALDGDCRVVGLSMSAVRLAGVSGLADGTPVTLAFRLPGHRGPVRVQGRALPQPADAHAVEVAIEGFEGNGERVYQQHVLTRVGADTLDRQAEALTAPQAQLVPLTEPDRILDLLADSLAFRADTLVGGSDLPAPVRTRLVGLDAREVLLEFEAGTRGVPLAGTRVRCSLLSRHGPYLFQTEVRGRTEAHLRLAFPERVHQYEKRARPRIPLRAASAAAPADRIVMTLPAVYGGLIERPLIDVSEVGAAFRSLRGDPLFLPGTPLQGVVLVRDGQPGPPRPAEVRQVSPEPSAGGEPAFRIGIVLDVERARPGGAAPKAPAAPPEERRLGRLVQTTPWLRRIVTAASGKLATAQARLADLRARAAPSGPLVNVVRYRGRRGEAIVGLLNATRPIGRAGERLRGPLVVIPPAYGKTKETYTALALMLVDAFRRHGQDVVVVRYDGTHAVGESHKEPENWPEERQMLRYTLSQGADDLLATLDHFHGRPWFRPTHTIVVSFSLAALWTRRVVLDDPFRRITHWISVVGAPDAQEVVLNATGGFDAIGGHLLGARFGTVCVLNQLIDADNFAANAVASGVATLQDARRDLARVRVPVSWFVGRDDRWVRSERVYDVMSVAAPAPREVFELPVGHTMRSSVEALASFETIIRHLWRRLYGDAPVDIRVDEAHLKRVANLERGRLPRKRLGEAKVYWEKYLLGEDGRGVAWDLWSQTPSYRELLDLTRQLLDVSEGDVVADLGAGTGNFVEHLLDRLVRDGFRTSPKRVIVADLVPSALALARRKTQQVLDGVLVPSDFLEFRQVNLETSRLRPIRRFLAGEFPSVDGLRGLVDGLPDATIDAWLAVYDERLHAWLRGAAPAGPLRAHVASLVKGGDFKVAVEFNRAARWVLGRVVAEDVADDVDPVTARGLLAEPHLAAAEALRFDRLKLDGPGLSDALPFGDASLDRVVLNLVLSYLFDPGETVREVYRILRPGGRIVASTMRPDADLSRAVTELIEHVRARPETAERFGVSPDELLTALQRYLNQAAGLLELEEGGVFRFFSHDELTRLFEQAGFDQVKVYESFGRPAQALVAVGVKR